MPGQGLYASLISELRRLRGARVQTAKNLGDSAEKARATQALTGRLRQPLDVHI